MRARGGEGALAFSRRRGVVAVEAQERIVVILWKHELSREISKKTERTRQATNAMQGMEAVKIGKKSIG